MAQSRVTTSGKNSKQSDLDLLDENLKFEEAMTELEAIVLSMDNGNLKLDESVVAYRRGTQLLKHCRTQLAEAEKKIQIFEDGSLADFDLTGGEKRE